MLNKIDNEKVRKLVLNDLKNVATKLREGRLEPGNIPVNIDCIIHHVAAGNVNWKELGVSEDELKEFARKARVEELIYLNERIISSNDLTESFGAKSMAAKEIVEAVQAGFTTLEELKIDNEKFAVLEKII